MKEDTQKIKRKYWIKFHIYECVLCGHTEEYRERIYDKSKPDNYNERYIYNQEACGHHFC